MGRFKFALKSLNCDGRWGVALAGACGVLLVVAAAGEGPMHALRYEREALAAGQWYRLATGHFVHLNLQHAALNALGFVLLWALFARDYAARHWVWILAATLAAIDAGLWFFDPALSWYVGASGALHGVLAAGTLAHLRRREPDGWVLLAFLCAKLAYEQFGVGVLPFSSGLGPVIVDAHLYGALAGVGASVLLPLRRGSL